MESILWLNSLIELSFRNRLCSWGRSRLVKLISELKDMSSCYTVGGTSGSYWYWHDEMFIWLRTGRELFENVVALHPEKSR